MIQLRLYPQHATPAFSYRVAGRLLVADRELSWLAPFALAGGGAAGLPAVGSPAVAAVPGETLYTGEIFLARQERFLSCRRLVDTFHFDVEGLGEFRYRQNEALLEVVAANEDAATALLAEVLLGPLLALALAQRGVFLLHASGCELDGAVWLMLGESGVGKSTLAASLGGSRLADDQAAVDAGNCELLTDFPQPKLEPALQALLAGVGRRALHGLLLVEKAPADAEPELILLPRLDAAAGILRHTTGARCFDQLLLRRHLDFAAGLSARVACYRLVYPHRPDACKKIGALLARG
jgi:hypothetical protein